MLNFAALPPPKHNKILQRILNKKPYLHNNIVLKLRRPILARKKAHLPGLILNGHNIETTSRRHPLPKLIRPNPS